MKNPFNLSSVGSRYKLGGSETDSAESWAASMVPGWLSTDRLTTPHSHKSLTLLAVSVALLFFLFSVRLFQIQIVEGAQFKNQAAGNRTRERILYAERGVITDRNGVVLAQNTGRTQLVVLPYLLEEHEQPIQNQITVFADVLGVEASIIEAKINAQGVHSPLPVLLADKLTQKQVVQTELIINGYPAFSLDVIPSRSYVSDAALGHILGYVNRASEADVSTRDDILPIDFVGREGIEYSFDSLLRGKNGSQITEVDALGEGVRTLANNQASGGNDLRLSIDYAVQKTLAESLAAQIKKASAKRGAAVAINPKTGEVLALVSLPSYDNNLFANDISNTAYTKLLNHPNRPLFNRVISGGYPTGSAVKPLVASAALHHKIITEKTTLQDQGSITLVNPYNSADTLRFEGYQGRALGPVNVKTAIAKSSNIFFYTVGGGYGSIKGLGGNRLGDNYEKFGFGSKSGIDLPGEITGVVPDPDWKKKVLDLPWYTGDSYNISIGQGDLQVSPIQLAMAHAALINGGNVLKPQLIAGSQPEIKGKIGISAKNLGLVREGMRLAVTEGTIGESNFKGLPPVAGKTGTAETVTRSDSSEPHVWIATHAPANDPTILVVAMIEHGTYSSLYLSPVAGDTMRAYFNQF